MKRHAFFFAALVTVCLCMLRCSTGKLAGATDMPNEQTTITAGILYGPDRPASGVTIMVVPSEYLAPIPGNLGKTQRFIARTTTDESGNFYVDSLDNGDYVIEANDEKSAACVIRCQIDNGIKNRKLGVFTIKPFGAIAGKIDTAGGSGITRYVQIFGLNRVALVKADGTFGFDSIPADTFTLRITCLDSTKLPVLYSTVQTRAGETVPDYPGLNLSKQVFLNTTVGGANVPANVYNFPVLVRLTNSNFMFNRAQPKGQDLRIIKSNGTLLPFEIEQWDSAAGLAEIWVKVDTVFGNNNSQNFWLFWGAGTAGTVHASLSNGATVFDTANGFQGVWHMGQTTGSVVNDATVNHFDATPSDTAPVSVAGVVGAAAQFDGVSSFLTMKATASGKLNFPEQGIYMVSAWVMADTLKTGDNLQRQYILQKGNNQYTLQLSNSQNWDFGEYESANRWSYTASPGTAHVWSHIAAVRINSKMYLYVNGICADSTVKFIPLTEARSTDADLVIGKHAGAAFTSYFAGKVDEVRIENSAVGADWIRLCYMNQRIDDKLTQIK